MSQQFISKEKKAELEKELKNLIEVRRKEIADALEYSKSLGDLSENAEYHQAREDQAYCEDRIREIEDLLRNAIITQVHESNKVEVGTVVHVQKKGSKDVKIYTIVGGEEADIDNNKISYESALGSALMGHSDGDEISFTNPKGEKVVYKLMDVE